MDTVVLDAEYIDSDDGSDGSITEELWSPHSESDRSCVPVSSPQAFDSPASKIRRELSSVERQMRWAVKALRDWCKSEGLNTEFEELPSAELNSILEKFYTNARRKDGVDFSKAGWNNIRVGIDRFLRGTLQPGFTIMKNPEFESSNRIFDAKLSRLVMSGTTPMRRAGSISPNDLEKLLSSGVFSCSQPLNLLRACWFNVSLHFNVGGHLKQRKLNKFQFVFKTNSSGIEYVQFASSAKDREQLLNRTSDEDEETTVMYAVPHHPLCPVKLLKKYLKKLHPGIDALYQCPVPYAVDERVPIWYEKQALGVHLLEAMMGKISKDAHLSRVYSNTSLRATSPLVYVSCGFGSSVQSQSLHLDVGVTDISSTPSRSQESSTAPRTSSDSCVIATVSNTLMFNAASATGCHPSATVKHGDSNMPQKQPIPDSIFPSTSVQDSYDIVERDVFASHTPYGSSSPLNMPIKIQSVYGGVDVAVSLTNSEVDISSFHKSANEATALKDGIQDNSRLPTHDKSYLRLQVIEGKLFLEPDVSHIASEGVPAAMTKVVLNIHFMNQRVKSTPVRCGYELPIKEDFFLEFENIDNSDVGALLSIPDKVHITLTSIDQNGRTSLVSSYYLEWHRVLAMEDGNLASSLELIGVGLEAKMITGSLEVKLEIVPKLKKIMTQDEVRSHLSLSQCRVSERDRHFMSYARQWWRELVSSGSSQSSRCVKIFSQDECGSNRPVVSYVRPLQVSWGLDTPCDAAKFVSLLGFQEEASMWGGRNEIWNSLHAFLSCGKGGCEDHATLLCSLLLGFGLNAHVCCGTKRDGTPHVWVMTQKRDGDVTFWESVTGKRFNFDSDTLDSEMPFKTVGCVFNHKSFYANIQSSDLVSSCCFDLDNASHWKALSQERIAAFCGADISPPMPKFPPLLAPTIHPGMASHKMEEEMKAVISQHRKSLGLASDWDSGISYCLGPALCSHKLDDLDDVKETVRGKIPPGYSFSSRPLVFNHRNGRQAVEHILTISDFESVILGNGVTLALRVRVTPYPENRCVTQVLIAGFCRPTDSVVKFDWRDFCTTLNPEV